MKRNFEKELFINSNGKTFHNECIDHCLLYAFGDCNQTHTICCDDCKEFFNCFEDLREKLPSEYYDQLNEASEKLKYWLSHHARKVYLNAQFKSSLAQLDSNGAVMIADYKMRILPRSVRETKQEFFGK